MKQPAMIWKESVYNGGFICRCGADLLADGALRTGFFQGVEYKICRKCSLFVARIEEIEAPEKLAPGKYGSYIEFQRKKRMS